jgi:hypothetical protein
LGGSGNGVYLLGDFGVVVMNIYRICPTRPLVIERSIKGDTRWYFYMVTDSPNEAKRIVGVLNTEYLKDIEQGLLLAGSHD